MIELIKRLLQLFKRADPVKPPIKLHVSENCIELIKYFEGCKLKAYRDVTGVLTIGYGDTKNVTANMVITQEQAEYRLISRIEQEFEPGVLANLRVSVTQGELDALISFAYNLGVGALAKSTLLKYVNENKPLDAAREFPRWVNAGGQALLGLKRRRVAEQAVFLGDDYKTAIAKAEAVK